MGQLSTGRRSIPTGVIFPVASRAVQRPPAYERKRYHDHAANDVAESEQDAGCQGEDERVNPCRGFAAVHTWQCSPRRPLRGRRFEIRHWACPEGLEMARCLRVWPRTLLCTAWRMSKVTPSRRKESSARAGSWLLLLVRWRSDELAGDTFALRAKAGGVRLWRVARRRTPS